MIGNLYSSSIATMDKVSPFSVEKSAHPDFSILSFAPREIWTAVISIDPLVCPEILSKYCNRAEVFVAFTEIIYDLSFHVLFCVPNFRKNL